MKPGIRLTYVRVIVIAAALVVLAKMVGPQSSQASLETNTGQLINALLEVRASLDLYRAEHGGRLPQAGCPEDFAGALTGEVGGYGPYLEQMPTNPFNGLDTVRFDGAPAGANKAGWRFDTQTGLFQADNDKPYAAL
jgi:hypothetical protein